MAHNQTLPGLADHCVPTCCPLPGGCTVLSQGGFVGHPCFSNSSPCLKIRSIWRSDFLHLSFLNPFIYEVFVFVFV